MSDQNNNNGGDNNGFPDEDVFAHIDQDDTAGDEPVNEPPRKTGQGGNGDLSKYGYDPLDDIKPIDVGLEEPARRRKDQTYADPVSLGEDSAASRAERERPVSMLENQPEIAGIGVKELYDAEQVKDRIFKGDYFNITQRDPTLRQMIVGAGWEQRAFDKDPLDLDLSCFLLDKSDMTRADEDFIFYNNPLGCDGAVKLLEDSRGGAGDGDDERIFMDLNGVPFDVVKIMFAISIYDEKLAGYKFGDVRDLYIRFVNYDTEEELARFILPEEEVAQFNGMFAVALVREGPLWYLQPLAETVSTGLSPIARKYGLIIAEEAG